MTAQSRRAEQILWSKCTNFLLPPPLTFPLNQMDFHQPPNEMTGDRQSKPHEAGAFRFFFSSSAFLLATDSVFVGRLSKLGAPRGHYRSIWRIGGVDFGSVGVRVKFRAE